MTDVLMWAWDDVNKVWIKVQVTVDGELKIKAG